jgi:hypothetical protein
MSRNDSLSEADKAEIATFIDTGKTILHQGRTFHILNPPPDEHRAESPWILRSQSGGYYALLRNLQRPELLFGVALYQTPSLPGWFTDKSGELLSLG